MPNTITEAGEKIMAVGEDTSAPVPADTAMTAAGGGGGAGFVPDADGAAGPERQAEHPGWAYALSTDAVRRSEAVQAVASVIAGYMAAASPSDEVASHLEAAEQAAEIIVTATGDVNDKVRVFIGGRATPGHAIVPGPDEMLTISVSVVDIPDPEIPAEQENAPVAVEGGSFLAVD